MTVAQLKELLQDIPKDMTIEEFNELEVMFSNDGNFEPPDINSSGIVHFEPEEDDTPDTPMTIFALTSGFSSPFDINYEQLN